MKRRDFLKLTGAAGASSFGFAVPNARAAKSNADDPEFLSILVDTTRCNGCRKCEEACAETNGLTVPDISDKSVFADERRMSPDQWTVVNRYQTETGEFFVKRQCMHCNQPGCATACLVRAMYKTREGPVIWRGDKCMGCRYCMISCPFNVPKFEYDSPNPKIQKCVLCEERRAQGRIPACVEGCPVEALTFGTRRDLLHIARTKIVQEPERYVDHIYGEHEVGGLGMLYLAGAPFEQLGFKMNLGTTPVPEHTQDFLYSVPIILLLWPAFLFGASQSRRAKQSPSEEVLS